MELTGCENNEVSAVLGQELDALLVVLVDKLPEILRNDTFLDTKSVLTDIGDLKEHRSSHVHRVDSLTVDV